MKVILVTNRGRTFNVHSTLVVADDAVDAMVKTVKHALEGHYRITVHDVDTPTALLERMTEAIDCPDCLGAGEIGPEDSAAVCGTCKGSGEMPVKEGV